jgi:hypothetical protein
MYVFAAKRSFSKCSAQARQTVQACGAHAEIRHRNGKDVAAFSTGAASISHDYVATQHH